MSRPAKRLVVCCDGTWNQADQKSPTNVTRIAQAVRAEDSDGVAQVKYYQPGVGTKFGEKLRGGAFGRGLARNVREAYRFLVDNFDPGDELFLMGFSRGAFTARSTAGFVRNCGILRREHLGHLDEAYDLYRSRGSAPASVEARAFRAAYSYETPIRFIGVWDTVGALGIPGNLLSFLNRNTRFHDTELSSTVQAAYQALAVDERRRPFKPTIWHTKPAADQVVEQHWFAGAHSNVGGGYPDHGLSDITLTWLAGKAADHGLAIDHKSLSTGDPLAELRNSYTGFYRLTIPYRRPIGVVSPVDEEVAVSVDDRMVHDHGYRPRNVEDYRAKVGAPR